MLSCSVKDLNYSDDVQAVLSRDDFLCFTTQNREDHRKLSDQFYRVMGLSVTIRRFTEPLSSFRPPMSPEQLLASGLQGFALEYLEGPATVVARLCSERQIHQAALSTKKITNEQHEELVNRDKIRCWTAGKVLYRVRRRREYGPEAVTTSGRNISPGQYWTDQPVDAAEKAELRKKLDEAQAEYEDMLAENKALKVKDREVLVKIREVSERIVSFLPGRHAGGQAVCDFLTLGDQNELRTTKNQLQLEHNKWLALPDKIGAWLWRDDVPSPTNMSQNRKISC